MLKEATIKLDGLSVIAGENDTGKSTVGKTLFALLKAKTFAQFDNSGNRDFFKKLSWVNGKVFKGELFSKNSVVKFDDIVANYKDDVFNSGDEKFLEAIFIETPFVWNLYDFFQTVARVSPMTDINIPYPFLSWDLFIKLSNENKKEYLSIEADNLLNKITTIQSGTFIHLKSDYEDKYLFKRDNINFKLENVATGIKYFGILEALLRNFHITRERILIFDEPEVHLHPKWQLEMAKIIVELVKNGVKVLVNSHSPYMIEALKRYSEVENIEDKSSFYLAEDGYIKYQDSLEDIFEKLALPMRELKRVKLNRYLND